MCVQDWIKLQSKIFFLVATLYKLSCLCVLSKYFNLVHTLHHGAGQLDKGRTPITEETLYGILSKQTE